MSNITQSIREVTLTDVITGNYQRPISQSRVMKIIRSFDPAKLGVLLMNHRTDGKYAVLDGQHRLAVLRTMGIDSCMAIVMSGMTEQEEADYFRRQNENQTRLNCFDLYNAGLHARDEHYLRIDNILSSHGFRAGRQGGPMQVTAVSSLSQIVQRFGFDVLDGVFAYIQAAWPADSTTLRREMLAGLAEFYARFGRVVTAEQFGNRMGDKLPSALFYEYRRRTEGRVTARNAFNKSMRFTCCAVLVEAYNKGLNSKSRNRLKLEWHIDREI